MEGLLSDSRGSQVANSRLTLNIHSAMQISHPREQRHRAASARRNQQIRTSRIITLADERLEVL